MKFQNCFIDEDGNVWKTKSLIEHSKDIPVRIFNLWDISLDEVLRWQLTTVHDYCVHYTRVKNADLTVPIILRDDGYVMDGWHRVIKAMVTGVKELPCRRFKVNPPPDFKAE